jgi:hypothetical protein
MKSKNNAEEESKMPIYDANNMLPPRGEQQQDYEVMPYDEPQVKHVTEQMNSWAIGDEQHVDLNQGTYDEEKMRQEFREALGNWRGDNELKQQVPNDGEGWGVSASSQPPTKTNIQIGTDDRLKAPMVTTTVQHRGGDVHAPPNIEDKNLLHNIQLISPPSNSQNYGPIPQERIRARPFKAAKKVSCYNCYLLGDDRKFVFDVNLTKSYFWNEKWVELYHAKYSYIWPVDRKAFMKSEGTLALTRWYWSDECADKDTESLI